MARDAKWVAGRRVNVRQVLASEDARDLTKGLQAAQDFIDEHRTFGRLGQCCSLESAKGHHAIATAERSRDGCV